MTKVGNSVLIQLFAATRFEGAFRILSYHFASYWKSLIFSQLSTISNQFLIQSYLNNNKI